MKADMIKEGLRICCNDMVHCDKCPLLYKVSNCKDTLMSNAHDYILELEDKLDGRRMDASDYQRLASRTMNHKLTQPQTQLHALHEMASEVGEIHSIFQKVYQGHAIDEEELQLEVGDLLWGIAELCTVRGWDLTRIMIQNIDKLKKRYPDGFDAERSLHREGERS